MIRTISTFFVIYHTALKLTFLHVYNRKTDKHRLVGLLIGIPLKETFFADQFSFSNIGYSPSSCALSSEACVRMVQTNFGAL